MDDDVLKTWDERRKFIETEFEDDAEFKNALLSIQDSLEEDFGNPEEVSKAYEAMQEALEKFKPSSALALTKKGRYVFKSCLK